MKAIWQVESQVNVDETGAEFATRNSYGGLSGAYGTVLFGRHDTPLKMLGRKVDLFGDKIGDSRNLIGLNQCGCDLRLDNTIMYSTPDIKGLNAKAAYSTEEGSDDTSIVSVMATYGLAGLTVGGAYQEYGDMLTGTDTDEDDVIDTPSDKSETALRFMAKYKIKALQLMALYEMLGDVGGVSGADRDTWGGGVSYDAGKSVLKGQYYSTDGVERHEGASMVTVGVDHKLSKKTTVYLAYAVMDNQSMATHRVTNGHGERVTPAEGDDPSGVSLGFIHDF